MGQILHQPPPPSSPHRPQPERVVHFSIQPKTWYGKLLASLAAAAIIVVALVVSVVALAFVACVLLIVGGWLVFKLRQVRKRMAQAAQAGAAAANDPSVIEGEVIRRDER
jgi:hypothetical protein